MAGKNMAAAYHCGMCNEQFTSRPDYNTHMQNHADSGAAKCRCAVCNFEFSDSHQLDQHQILNGHKTPEYPCRNCGKPFITARGLLQHTRKKCVGNTSNRESRSVQPTPAVSSTPITCDRCSTAFNTKHEYNSHRSFKTNGPCADHNHKTPPKKHGGYQDPDKPKDAVRAVLEYPSSDEQDTGAGDSTAETPTDLSDNELWCRQCENKFPSMAKYNAHALWCVSKHGSSNYALEASEPIQHTPKPKQHQKQSALRHVSDGSRLNDQRHKTDCRLQEQISPYGPQAVVESSLPSTPPASSSAAAASTSLMCGAAGCDRTFRSQAALKVHKTDVHGIGGRGLDLAGRDAWMLTQRARNEYQMQGLLKPASSTPPSPGPGSGRGRGRGRGGRARAAPSSARLSPLPVPRGPQHFAPAPIPAFGAPTGPSNAVHHPLPQMLGHHVALQSPMPVPPSGPVGGAFEMEQARDILSKTLRLLIQSDIFIHADGKFTVCDIHWKRISVDKQRDVVVMLDGMCHLPKIVQGEYLPPSKAFMSEYNVHYSAADFSPSPARDVSKPGLAVVALACSKVVLGDGLQEVVKIAAVDLATCRVLMNHLVCTDPTSRVVDWRSKESGLFSWNDLEQARLRGYKVFKGWPAARTALWKYVDKDTIIVGHNLRSDLDALRMVHGRAVDVIKVAEKAANGPLSKAQLSLDSLCRDLPAVALKSDPEYGRDMLMNAFAVREMLLWVVKNKDVFERRMRQKSVEYQAIMPRAAAV